MSIDWVMLRQNARQVVMEAIARPAHVTCCPVHVTEDVVSIEWVANSRQNAGEMTRDVFRIF